MLSVSLQPMLCQLSQKLRPYVSLLVNKRKTGTLAMQCCCSLEVFHHFATQILPLRRCIWKSLSVCQIHKSESVSLSDSKWKQLSSVQNSAAGFWRHEAFTDIKPTPCNWCIFWRRSLGDKTDRLLIDRSTEYSIDLHRPRWVLSQSVVYPWTGIGKRRQDWWGAASVRTSENA